MAIPGVMTRAYADDLATVCPDMWHAVDVLAPIFGEFAGSSGLHLNIGKVVLVPLGDIPPGRIRDGLAMRQPAWGAIAIRHWAEYLGFVLGPDRSDRSWSKALAKMHDRAALWGALDLGLQAAALVWNTYIITVVGFLLQLDVLPPSWQVAEAAALRRLVPGPGFWVQPHDLHNLRQQLGFVTEFRDAKEISLAARFRVAHREALSGGGLGIATGLRRLAASVDGTDHLVRLARWRSWFGSSFVARLDEAVCSLGHIGITITSIEHGIAGASARP